MEDPSRIAGTGGASRVARNVLLLGAVSFLADVSGDMLFAVLPFFVAATATAGGVGVAVGLVGGVGDGVAELVKVVAGRASDRAGRRKPLVVLGYFLAAVGKLGLALAASAPGAVVLRALERVGKGVRTAPRDALIAESVAASRRGAGFGLHRAMDAAGAVVGVAVALALTAWGVGAQSIILVAAAIGFTTLVPLAFVREPRGVAVAPKNFRVALAGLPREFRRFVLVAVLFGLARFTLLLFILRASIAFAPQHAVTGPILLYLVFNVAAAAGSYPAGLLADRVGRSRVWAAGIALYVVVAAGFALATSVVALGVLFALRGVVYALAEGTGRAVAVDHAGDAGRGTALGTYHAVSGVATVLGGAVAGILWDVVSPEAAFWWAALASAAALAVGAAAGVLRAPPRASAV